MKLTATLAAAALTFAAVPAQAATYLFEITGDYTGSFEIVSNPVPDDVDDDVAFEIYDVAHANAYYGLADVRFYHASWGGGMRILDWYSLTYGGGPPLLFFTDGPQLYSGDESDPTFLTGTFALTEYGGPGTYTLKITDLDAVAVPEPASWAMMIGGFGLMGGLMRRRRRVQVDYATA